MIPTKQGLIQYPTKEPYIHIYINKKPYTDSAHPKQKSPTKQGLILEYPTKEPYTTYTYIHITYKTRTTTKDPYKTRAHSIPNKRALHTYIYK